MISLKIISLISLQTLQRSFYTILDKKEISKADPLAIPFSDNNEPE